MIWNYTKPVIINRLFLKPMIYYIKDSKLQNELNKIYEKYL